MIEERQADPESVVVILERLASARKTKEYLKRTPGILSKEGETWAVGSGQWAVGSGQTQDRD
jgi:hypothetical protein